MGGSNMTKLSKLIVSAGVIGISVPGAWAEAQITALVNAASFQSGLPKGGSLATIYCSGLTSVRPGTYVAASSSPLPYTLGGLSVTINTGMAPMLAVVIDSSGNAQVNFQVPLEATGQYAPSIEACGAGAPAASFDYGGFFADANGYAIAQHASDYSLVTPQNPAHPGEAIVAYADDFFPVWPPPPIGFPVPEGLLFQVLPAAVASSNYFVGGPSTYLYLQTYPQPFCMIGTGCDQSFTNTPALQVTFEGLAPGMVGVEQINFVVPANQQPGNWALFFNEGSCPDGKGGPESCGVFGSSSPYVILPVQ
jgi:uncharacterized protein (TIGR03437 family)